MPKTRLAGGGGHRIVCPCANFAWLFGADHWCRGATIAMGNRGGVVRLSISKMMNLKIRVARDPTSGGTIRSTQAKSTVCAPQVLLATALGKSVGWAN